MQKKPIALKYTLFLAVGIVLFIALLIFTQPEAEQQNRTRPPMQVSVTQATTADIQPQIRVTGILKAVQQAQLQFQISGRIEKTWVEPGQMVKQGDELLRLEDADFRDLKIEAEARYQQEQAAVERDKQLLALAEANIELQQAEVARQQRLGSDALSSRASLDSARQRLIQLQAEREQLRFSTNTASARLAIQNAAAQRAQRNWQRTRLTAPFDGTVNQVMVKKGDDVAARDQVIELINSEQLDFYTEIDLASAQQLAIGQTIQIEVNKQNYPAKIIALQSAANTETYTYALRARFDNPGLLAGNTAEAYLMMRPLTQVIVVPVSAVVHDDGQSYLFVVIDNRLHKRPVTLGIRQDNQQVILEGLAMGEQLVSRGGAGLSDKLEVTY